MSWRQCVRLGFVVQTVVESERMPNERRIFFFFTARRTGMISILMKVGSVGQSFYISELLSGFMAYRTIGDVMSDMTNGHVQRREGGY